MWPVIANFLREYKSEKWAVEMTCNDDILKHQRNCLVSPLKNDLSRIYDYPLPLKNNFKN